MSEETMGMRIVKLRNEFSYSQEYVAEKIGVSRQAVSKWEQNQSSPDTNNLIALSQLFNVSVEYLAIGKMQEQINTKEAGRTRIENTQKIIGYMLLGTGLLSLVLGLIFTFVLVIISAYLITAGAILLIVKKNLTKILTGSIFAMTLVLIAFTHMVNEIGAIFVIALALVIVVTLIKVYNKNSAE